MDVVDALAHRGRFFRVLQQTERSQTAVMTIAPGEDGGPEEEHAGDQIVYVVEGEAIVRIGDKEHRAAAGSLVMIPARTAHHVKNSGRRPLSRRRCGTSASRWGCVAQKFPGTCRSCGIAFVVGVTPVRRGGIDAVHAPDLQ